MDRIAKIAGMVTMLCFIWGLTAPVCGHSGERENVSAKQGKLFSELIKT